MAKTLIRKQILSRLLQGIVSLSSLNLQRNFRSIQRKLKEDLLKAQRLDTKFVLNQLIFLIAKFEINKNVRILVTSSGNCLKDKVLFMTIRKSLVAIWV